MEKRRGVLLGLIVAATLALSGVAHADHATEMKAREDFAAGRYDDALELFAKLYAETLNPVYLRNIGRCHQKLRHPDKAIDAFKDYLAKGKKISTEERAEINGYIKDMEALRDEQAKQQQAAPPVVTATPPPATPPPATPPPVQPLPPAAGETPGGYPGAYGAAPQGEPFPPAGQQPSGALVTQPGPAPDAQSAPFYTRWWFWTIVGAAVVGGVVAAVVLSSGTDKPPCSAAGITGLVCK
ncbi:MAG: tetratricopeptide repeat protein [Pseudomonadota bacterium]